MRISLSHPKVVLVKLLFLKAFFFINKKAKETLSPNFFPNLRNFFVLFFLIFTSSDGSFDGFFRAILSALIIPYFCKIYK